MKPSKNKSRFRNSPVNPVLVVIFAAFAMLTLFYQDSGPGSGINITVNSMVTDKELYHSGEQMSLNVSFSTDKIENLTVRISGVPDRNGNHRISGEKIVSGSGAEFLFSMPSCYGCAGVSPGNYPILCELVSQNGTVLANYTKTIELAQ